MRQTSAAGIAALASGDNVTRASVLLRLHAGSPPFVAQSNCSVACTFQAANSRLPGGGFEAAAQGIIERRLFLLLRVLMAGRGSAAQKTKGPGPRFHAERLSR